MLDAAAAEFAESGYADSSMTAIATRAGFTKGAVYSNFESKQSLLADVLLERAVDAIRVSVDRISSGGVAAPSLPSRAAQVLADQLGEQHHWVMLGAEFAVQAARDPTAREAYQRFRAAQRDVLSSSLREHAAALGLPAGLTDSAVDRAAIALLAVLNGLAVECAACPGVLDSADLIAVLTEVIVGLIGTDLATTSG